MTPYRHMFIGVLGWLDTHLPWWFVESYACLLLAVGLSDGGPSLRLGARSRLILGLTVLVMMIGLSFVFYLTWTEVGGLLVKGVQGRYFIPVAPLVLLVMTSEKAGGVSARDRVVRGRDFAGPRRALLYMTLSGLKVMTPQATGKQERSKGGGRTIALDSWNRIFRGRATRAC